MPLALWLAHMPVLIGGRRPIGASPGPPATDGLGPEPQANGRVFTGRPGTVLDAPVCVPSEAAAAAAAAA